MSDVRTHPRPVPRWLAWWAVATVAITAIPVTFGGWVTSIKAGMADPVWPTTPWYLFFIDWQEPHRGYLIEHRHRLAGYLIGCCVIVLAVGLWFQSRSPVMRWLGVFALGAVILQGMLGGFRVVLNAIFGSQLATIHGTFAQIVFALLAAIAVLSFPGRPEDDVEPQERRRMQKLSIALMAIVMLQIVFGAILRHTPNPVAQRLHLITAFAVVAFAVLVIRQARSFGLRFLRTRVVLMGLLAVQLLLGVEAWLGKFQAGVLPDLQEPTAGQVLVRILHVLGGACVLSTSVAFALMAYLPGGLALDSEVREERDLLAARSAQPIGGAV